MCSDANQQQSQTINRLHERDVGRRGRALGARRISLGSSLYQATMGAFSEMVHEALTTGSLKVDTPVLGYDLIESLF